MSQTTTPKISPAQQNAMARDLIFSRAKPIFQRVTSKTFTNVAQGNNQMVVNPLQIGFVKSFWVEITATIDNPTGGATANLTPNGLANLLQNVQFNDFTGNPRHNASGRAFQYVEAAKYGRIPGAALTSDSQGASLTAGVGFGSNVASNYAPDSIAAAGNATVTALFEIPIMLDSGKNMAGGMWLGVNNQSTLLTLTLNPTPITATTADPLLAVYQAASVGAGTQMTSATVTVYQDYWNFSDPSLFDPKSGSPILPVNDVSNAYMITETNSGMTFAAGQTSSWNFPTFSKLLGTYVTYDNGNTLNPGTDIETLALVVSNYSIIKQYDPNMLDRLTRNVMKASYPKGTYAIMSRMHPLDVSQYPSLQLQITPSSAAAGAYAMITTELLRPVQFMAMASGVGAA